MSNPKTFGERMNEEIEKIHAHLDRREAELDKFGYGGDPSKPRPQTAMTSTGKWRVYFNRHGAAPLMWCVSPDDGSWEIAVRSVQIATIAETIYKAKATPDEDDGKPSAWIAVEGQLTVFAGLGYATIGTP